MRFHVLPLALVVSLSLAHAGRNVDVKDLAGVPPEGLSALEHEEFSVVLAEVALEEAKKEKDRANKELRDVKRALQAETMDLKAAKAEEKAARANDDGTRTSAAEAAVSRARHDHSTATLLIEWKEKELKARHLGVDRAKQQLVLAEARLNLVRARALQAAHAPSASKHPVAKYEKEALEAQKGYDSVLGRATKATEEAAKLERRWERQSGRASASR